MGPVPRWALLGPIVEQESSVFNTSRNCDHSKVLDGSDVVLCRRYPPVFVTRFSNESPNLGLPMGQAYARGVEVRWSEVPGDERCGEFRAKGE